MLRDLIRDHRPFFVFLMETKNKRRKLEYIRRGTWFNNACYVDPVGIAGGLALWWTDDINMDILMQSKNHILSKCTKEGSTVEEQYNITLGIYCSLGLELDDASSFLLENSDCLNLLIIKLAAKHEKAEDDYHLLIKRKKK